MPGTAPASHSVVIACLTVCSPHRHCGGSDHICLGIPRQFLARSRKRKWTHQVRLCQSEGSVRCPKSPEYPKTGRRKTSGGTVRKLPRRRGRHVPLLPLSSAYPVPELNEQNPRTVFLLTTKTEETINSAFHLVLHGPRKYSNFKLQGDEHSNHESVNLTVMESDSRTKVKKASLILSGSMPGWPSEGLSLMFSHADVPLWPSKPSCPMQQLVLASFFLSTGSSVLFVIS